MKKRSPQVYVVAIAFILFHLGCLTVFIVGVSPVAIAVFLASYVIRGMGITAGYHRLLAHRSFQTSRPMQFLFALAGSLAIQGGPLWWVSHHRSHHRYTETDQDIHSPKTKGFWQAHMGWMMTNAAFEEQGANTRDLYKFPEIKFLQRNYVWIIVAEMIGFYGLGVGLNSLFPQAGTSGAQIFVWGFVVATTMTWHFTFMVNSVCHTWGTRAYDIDDTSTNNKFVGLAAFGEGWHNNHHAYPLSAKHGLQKGQLDVTWLLLKGLEKLGLVSNLKLPKEFREASEAS